jgi:hypothetical protein
VFSNERRAVLRTARPQALSGSADTVNNESDSGWEVVSRYETIIVDAAGKVSYSKGLTPD